MRSVSIVGIGMTDVGEHWASSLREMAAEAGSLAVEDAQQQSVDALYVGNSYGSTISQQSHLGALVADYMGYSGIEAYAVEAGEASGAAALRTGYIAVASGAVNSALVIGVEKSTDRVGSPRQDAIATSLDADFEAGNGATSAALAALTMRRYMYEHDVALSEFEGFSVNAHRNGRLNPQAMFRNAIREGAFAKAPMIADPVSLFDSAPEADGSAAVLLVASDEVTNDQNAVRITGSHVATDSFAIQDREDLLYLNAVQRSATGALNQAGIALNAVDFMELHDSFTILTTLAIEALGITDRGHGWELAKNNGENIALDGDFPISTFGGLKSRGNPFGATGIYQAVEACRQLRHEAGDNQVADAKIALIQNLGGLASTAITHILQS